MAKEQVEEFEYKAEMKQLLHLIVHSLYTHPEVFLRELISNASDALSKIRFRKLTDSAILDPDAEFSIKIELDPKKQLFSIEDSGIGMTRDDLVNQIGTVAGSGTLQFLKQAQQNKSKLDGQLIGQFGVGFYSVFMVTEEVTIETRHADPDSKAYRWKSVGEGKFSIEEIDRANRGTRISFKLKDEYKDFSEELRVKNTIQKYSNFVDFPIYVGSEDVNKVSALWHRPKDSIKEDELIEFYKFMTNDYNPPLDHLQLSIEGAVTFKALLFVPETAPLRLFRDQEEKSLQLYSKKVLIQDDCKDLLPEYLRFVKGVVDTEDLPLNVSREVAQSSPVMAKIRNILTGRILKMLEEWADKDVEKYEKFYRTFGQLFKQGLNLEFDKRDRLIELLRFESSKTETDKVCSLKEYKSRMQKEQKEIYYLSGEHREAVEKNPNLEYFRKNNIEVLFLTDPLDVFIVPSIGEYEKTPIKSVEKADLDLKAEQAEGDALKKDLSDALIKVFRETLGDRVADVIVSKRLVESPATLVAGTDSMDPQMEKMMKMINKEYTGGKRILEINTAHPLIKNLSRINLGDSKDPILRNCILQVFEGALMIEEPLKSPSDFVSRMTEIMEAATR